MLEAGAHPGSLLFRGQVDNGQYSGTAYLFNPHCGAILRESRRSPYRDIADAMPRRRLEISRILKNLRNRAVISFAPKNIGAIRESFLNAMRG
jgi:hypothetical protein